MNPQQKAGNFKGKRKFRGKHIRNEKVIRNIARQEANKTVMKKAESKHFDTQITTQPYDWAGYATTLLLPIQGVTEHQLTGLSVEPTHIRIRGQLDTDPGTTPLRVISRIIVVQFKTDALLPADLLESVSSAIVPLSAYKDDFQNQYRVLHDEFYSMIPGTETEQITFDIKIKSDKLKKVSFGTIAGPSFVPTAGALALFVYSDIDPTGGTDIPTLTAFSRCYYKDL